MPRFYFDFREDGDFIEDQEGTVHPDANSAECEAVEAALGIAKDKLPERKIKSVTVDVRNESGEPAFSVTVSMDVKQSATARRSKRRSRRRDTDEGAEPP